MKRRHHFEIYERHFQKFVSRDVHVMAIGICSGGSLEMWRKYFGPGCTSHGVDFQPECKSYENGRTKILIGDQADRDFWKSALGHRPRPLDLIIDDGGHEFERQRVTPEGTLPSLAPGGICLCEDVHGARNHLRSYVNALIGERSAFHPKEPGNGDLAAEYSCFQQSIHWGSIPIRVWWSSRRQSHNGSVRGTQTRKRVATILATRGGSYRAHIFLYLSRRPSKREHQLGYSKQ